MTLQEGDLYMPPLLAGIQQLKDMRALEDRNRQAANARHAEEVGAIAKALGVTIQADQPWPGQLLVAIEKLKGPTPAAGGFELTPPAQGRKAKAPGVDVQVAVRDRLMQLATRLGVDTETLGVNGASAEEIEAAIEAQADQGGQVRALLEVLGRNGVDAGVRAALPLEALQAEVDALVHVLLPEIEIGCPHCQGGMLITPDLLKPAADEVPA